MGRIRPKTGQNAAPMATLSAATRSFCGRARHLDANRNNVVRLEDEAISVRGQMRQACVGIGVRHVAKFKAEHAWPDAREIDGTDDRPVVTFGIDLDQVDVGERASSERLVAREGKGMVGICWRDFPFNKEKGPDCSGPFRAWRFNGLLPKPC